jgi:hypothetical protein
MLALIRLGLVGRETNPGPKAKAVTDTYRPRVIPEGDEAAFGSGGTQNQPPQANTFGR